MESFGPEVTSYIRYYCSWFLTTLLIYSITNISCHGLCLILELFLKGRHGRHNSHDHYYWSYFIEFDELLRTYHRKKSFFTGLKSIVYWKRRLFSWSRQTCYFPRVFTRRTSLAPTKGSYLRSKCLSIV